MALGNMPKPPPVHRFSFEPDVCGLDRLARSSPSIDRQQRGDHVILTVRAPFCRERELHYREKFEQANDEDKGKVAAEFLRDAPSWEWPLAGWLFDAIGAWQSRGDQISKRNLKLIAGAVEETFSDLPVAKYLRRSAQDHKRLQLRKDALPVATELCLMFVPYCKQAKKHAKEHKFLRFQALVKHGDVGLPPNDKLSPKLRPFYAYLRSMMQEGLLEEADLDEFLTELSDRRPKRSAAFLAAKLSDLPWELVEKSAKVKAETVKRTGAT